MVAGGFNSAGFNSVGFRTDQGPATPAGSFSVYGFIETGFRVDGHWTTVSDSVYLAEYLYRVQGEVSIDGVVLPHVLSITNNETMNMDTRPVNAGLPVRSYQGKKGRSITIQGWTNSIATLNTIGGYADGAKHTVILPTGEGLTAYISRGQTPQDVQTPAPGVYTYTLEIQEAID